MSLPQEEPRNEMPGYERFMKNQYLQNKRKEGERTHIYTGPPPGIDRDGRSVVSPSHTYGDRVANGMNKSNRPQTTTTKKQHCIKREKGEGT